METPVKAALFVGTILLLGAGFYGRIVDPEALGDTAGRRRLRRGLVVGALLVIGSSLANIALILYGLFESLPPELFLDYLMGTRHGQATLARLVLALVLVAFGTGARGRKGTQAGETQTLEQDRVGQALPLHKGSSVRGGRGAFLLYSLLALAFLVSISFTSHSGVMGVLPLVGDTLHLIAASLWAGAVFYVAFMPLWSQRARLERAVTRVSSVGLFSVGLLFLTGIYLSSLQIPRTALLSGSAYVRALVMKLVLIGIILALAGVNRFFLMPKLARGGSSLPLRNVVRAEAFLLIAVLFATGSLTTREPPRMAHGAHEAAAPHEHGALHPYSVRSVWETPPRLGNAELLMFLEHDGMPLIGADIFIHGDMTHAGMIPLEEVAFDNFDGSYSAEIPFSMSGDWLLTLHVTPPEEEMFMETLRVTVP